MADKTILIVYKEESGRQHGNDLLSKDELFRMVIENAIEGIFIAQDGFVRFSNPKVPKIIGFRMEEILSREKKRLQTKFGQISMNW